MAMGEGGVKDGGPAFPVSDEASRFKVSGVFGGMTLRDYFDGQALAGMMSVPSGDDPSATAVYAYRIADALLAARGRS